MGEGLRKIAKLHGGLTVKDRKGNVAKYDGDGNLKSLTTKDGKTTPIISKSQERRVSTMLGNKPTENK